MFLVLAILLQPTDEEQALKVCETYFASMKKGEFEAAADAMHPMSLKKMRKALVGGADKEPDAQKLQIAAYWGFKTWKDLKDASDRLFFIHSCRKIGAAGAGTDAKFLGSLKKGEFVYVVAELTYREGDDVQVLPTLLVCYRDGERWKMANRGETNVGR